MNMLYSERQIDESVAYILVMDNKQSASTDIRTCSAGIMDLVMISQHYHYVQ